MNFVKSQLFRHRFAKLQGMMKFFTLLLVFFFEFSITPAQFQVDLIKVREWNQLDFNFPSPRVRADAIQKKLFVPLSNFPIDVDVDYQGKK